MKLNKTSKMVYMALLVSLALILSLIERVIPVPFVTPGAKLGLANLVIMLSVYTLDSYKDAFTVLVLRLILSTLLGGSVSMLLYSVAGGILSFLVILLVKTLGSKHVSIIGVSAAGSVFHNVGQLFIASLILNNFNVFLYLPLLSLVGICTGIFVGLSANYILGHIKKITSI
ncbi:MAG: Gx transporter family protein [Romboutsia sp.]